MDLGKLMGLMPLFNQLDPEAVQLFIEYGKKAMASQSPASFVKRTMRQALQDGPVVVQGTFVDD